MTPDQPHRECGHSSCGQNYIDTGDTACSLEGPGASPEPFCVEIGPDTHPTVSGLVRELLLSYAGDGCADSANATATEPLDEIDPRLND
tara:strand:+ start:427 stop:693 length:267 start_codon:yes stop_codon:yes gene_type:complete